MPYWPSYVSITPSARRAFLDWMAGGRKAPEYGIGHVFLFFYGLEHRQFIENSPTAARVLIPEVKRLLSIYGKNSSFQGYANNFLFHARLAARIPFDAPKLSPEPNGSPYLDPAVRLYLGGKLTSSDHLSAHDALLWTLALPDSDLHTPAVHCFDEFVAVWNLRFAEKFPTGFRVQVPSQTLKFSYRAASGAFEVDISGPHITFPDISAADQPLGSLKILMQACTGELEAFSRFVGRRPDQKSSLEAALLLPQVLQGISSHSVLGAIAAKVSELLGTRNSAITKLRELLRAASLDFPESGNLSPTVCDRLGQAFDHIGIAIEPDSRYGRASAQLDDPVVIFRADKGGPIDPLKPAYQAMKSQVEASALATISVAAEPVDKGHAILTHIRAAANLSRIEQKRLIAYLITMLNCRPNERHILRRLARMSERDRQLTAATAMSLTVKWSGVNINAVSFFERLYRAFGFPMDQVYLHLHRAAAGEPIVVSSESRISGIPIPAEAASGIRIDVDRLASVQKETQEVSRLLSQIFSENDETSALPSNAASGAKGSSLTGLDKRHAELVEYLEMNGEISRQEFDERAKSLKLLPDGAIETINEWSFHCFGEPLIEDGEHIVLSDALRQRIAEVRTSES
jgi:hypothetical protein